METLLAYCFFALVFFLIFLFGLAAIGALIGLTLALNPSLARFLDQKIADDSKNSPS